MKPFSFYGQPRSSAGLPDNLTPARLCAMAWARSNFPADTNAEILAIERDKSVVIVSLPQETVSFDFWNEVDAVRAIKQLPLVMECQSQFMLAADIDMDALTHEMNFGAQGPEMSGGIGAPAPSTTI
jgi:hypothetical protein